MTARPVVVNSGELRASFVWTHNVMMVCLIGYASPLPLAGLARLPGEPETVGVPIRREAVGQDPLAFSTASPQIEHQPVTGSGLQLNGAPDPFEAAVRLFISNCRYGANDIHTHYICSSCLFAYLLTIGCQ
jgi:hypothetical protein